MITLTMQCSRCSKEVSHDMTNKTLHNELIRKFGYAYAHNGKTNVLICNNCEKQFKGLEAKLTEQTRIEMCNFFLNCEKESNDRDKGKSNNG